MQEKRKLVASQQIQITELIEENTHLQDKVANHMDVSEIGSDLDHRFQDHVTSLNQVPRQLRIDPAISPISSSATSPWSRATTAPASASSSTPPWSSESASPFPPALSLDTPSARYPFITPKPHQRRRARTESSRSIS